MSRPVLCWVELGRRPDGQSESRGDLTGDLTGRDGPLAEGLDLGAPAGRFAIEVSELV